MADHRNNRSQAGNLGGRFVSTQWSLVISAGRRSSPDAEQALSLLCAAYWQPLYAYVRMRGYAVADAQDLTQSFFARVLDKDYLRQADRERGRFRSFLLASLKHFLANEWDRQHTSKRSGDLTSVSLEGLSSAEKQFKFDSVARQLTPEQLYEQRWALILLDQTINRLAAEFEKAGKTTLFEHLKPFLTGADDKIPYSQVATEVQMTEGAVKVAIHRLRQRYRDLLREEIAETLADPSAQDEIEDEIRYLMAALSS